MIRIEARAQPSQMMAYATPLLAVLLTMLFGGILFAVLGKDPVAAIATIFWEPIFGEFAFFYRPQLLIKGAPLVLIAIGLALGFRAGIWNIGAEGQYIVGAICGAGAGLAFYPTESVLIFPLMVLAGALGGGAWAMIPAALRAKLTTRYPDPEGNYAMGGGVYDDPVVGELWLHSGSNTVWYSQIAVSKRLDRVVIVNTNQFSDAAQTAANQVIKNVLLAAQDAQAEQIE